jgi:hypothetical protein
LAACNRADDYCAATAGTSRAGHRNYRPSASITDQIGTHTGSVSALASEDQSGTTVDLA